MCLISQGKKKEKNVPLKRNCAFAFWGSIIIMHNLPFFITKKIKSGLSRSKLFRHAALPVWSGCAKGCCITISFTHSFLQASQLLFLLFWSGRKQKKFWANCRNSATAYHSKPRVCTIKAVSHFIFTKKTFRNFK